MIKVFAKGGRTASEPCCVVGRGTPNRLIKVFANKGRRSGGQVNERGALSKNMRPETSIPILVKLFELVPSAPFCLAR